MTDTRILIIQVRSGGRFSFNTDRFGINESGGTATITVIRSSGSAGTATVNFATSNGTATSGTSCTSEVDYIPASGTFTWNNTDFSVRTFTITICNDGSNEDDETINLTLSDAGGTGSLGTAYPPTSKYLTPWELSNCKNSLKSGGKRIISVDKNLNGPSCLQTQF